MTPEKQTELQSRFDLPFRKLDYLANIDEERRIVYFETPKVACTSIKKYMIDKASHESIELAPSEVHNRQKSPLRMLSSYSDDAVDLILSAQDGYRLFCFVRDPYSRVLSAYLDKIITNEWERKRHLPIFGFEQGARPKFVDFLHRLSRISDCDRDIHYITQARLTGRLGGLMMGFVGRFEDFKSDFLRLKSEFYDDASTEDYQSFGKHHSSDAVNKLAAYYGDEERKIVRDIYSVDFAVYGYPL